MSDTPKDPTTRTWSMGLDASGFPVMLEQDASGGLFLAGVGVRDLDTASGNPWHDPKSGKFTNAPPGIDIINPSGAKWLDSISNASRQKIDKTLKRTGATKMSVQKVTGKDALIVSFFKSNGDFAGSLEIPDHDETKTSSGGTGQPDGAGATGTGPSEGELARRQAAVVLAAHTLPNFELDTLRQFLDGKTKRELTPEELIQFHDDVKTEFKNQFVKALSTWAGDVIDPESQAAESWLRNNVHRLTEDERKEVVAQAVAYDNDFMTVDILTKDLNALVEANAKKQVGQLRPAGGQNLKTPVVELPERVSAEWLKANIGELTNEQLDEVALRLTKAGGKDKQQMVNEEKAKRASSTAVNPADVTVADLPGLPDDEPSDSTESQVGTSGTSPVDSFIPTTNPSAGTSLGGTTGAKLQTINDKQYVVKQGASVEHIREEDLADRLYQAVGVAVPAHTLHKDDAGYPYKVAEYIPNAESLQGVYMEGDQAKIANVKEQLQAGFVWDALFANWDVVGLENDNVLVDQDGKVWRIDNGGSLRFRAMGAPKGNAFGNTVGELETLRNGTNAQTAKVFGDLTDEQVAQQIVSEFTEEKLSAVRDIVKHDPDLYDTLADRIDYMLGWAESHGATIPDPVGDENDAPGAGDPDANPIDTFSVQKFTDTFVGDWKDGFATTAQFGDHLGTMELRQIDEIISILNTNMGTSALIDKAQQVKYNKQLEQKKRIEAKIESLQYALQKELDALKGLDPFTDDPDELDYYNQKASDATKLNDALQDAKKKLITHINEMVGGDGDALRVPEKFASDTVVPGLTPSIDVSKVVTAYAEGDGDAYDFIANLEPEVAEQVVKSFDDYEPGSKLSMQQAKADLKQLAAYKTFKSKENYALGEKVVLAGKSEPGTIVKVNAKSFKFQLPSGETFTWAKTDKKIKALHKPPKKQVFEGAEFSASSFVAAYTDAPKGKQINALQKLTSPQLAQVYIEAGAKNAQSLKFSASKEHKQRFGKALTIDNAESFLSPATPTKSTTVNEHGVDTSKIKTGDEVVAYNPEAGGFTKGSVKGIIGGLPNVLFEGDVLPAVLDHDAIKEHWQNGAKVSGFAPGDVVEVPNPNSAIGLKKEATLVAISGDNAIVKFAYSTENVTVPLNSVKYVGGLDEEAFDNFLLQAFDNTQMQQLLSKMSTEQLGRAIGLFGSVLWSEPGDYMYEWDALLNHVALQPNKADIYNQAIIQFEDNASMQYGSLGSMPFSVEIRYDKLKGLLDDALAATPVTSAVSTPVQAVGKSTDPDLPTTLHFPAGIEFNVHPETGAPGHNPDMVYTAGSYAWWSQNQPDPYAWEPGAKSAVYAYGGSGHEEINSYLRGISKSLGGASDKVIDRIENLDKAFATVKGLDKPMEFYRGITATHDDIVKELQQLQPGEIYTDHGYASAGVSKSKAWKGFRYAIRVPKGYKTINMGDSIAPHASEQEVLLDRGMQMMYVGEVDGWHTFEIVGQVKRDPKQFFEGNVKHAIYKDPKALKKLADKLKQLPADAFAQHVATPEQAQTFVDKHGSDPVLADKIKQHVQSQIDGAPSAPAKASWVKIDQSLGGTSSLGPGQLKYAAGASVGWKGNLQLIAEKSGPTGFKEAADLAVTLKDPNVPAFLDSLKELALLNHSAAGKPGTHKPKGSVSSWQSAIDHIDTKIKLMNGEPVSSDPVPTPPPVQKQPDPPTDDVDVLEFQGFKAMSAFDAQQNYKWPNRYAFSKMKVPDFNKMTDIAFKHKNIAVLLALYNAAAMHASQPSWAKRRDKLKALLESLGYAVT